MTGFDLATGTQVLRELLRGEHAPDGHLELRRHPTMDGYEVVYWEGIGPGIRFGKAYVGHQALRAGHAEAVTVLRDKARFAIWLARLRNGIACVTVGKWRKWGRA